MKKNNNKKIYFTLGVLVLVCGLALLLPGVAELGKGSLSRQSANFEVQGSSNAVVSKVSYNKTHLACAYQKGWITNEGNNSSTKTKVDNCSKFPVVNKYASLPSKTVCQNILAGRYDRVNLTDKDKSDIQSFCKLALDRGEYEIGCGSSEGEDGAYNVCEGDTVRHSLSGAKIIVNEIDTEVGSAYLSTTTDGDNYTDNNFSINERIRIPLTGEYSTLWVELSGIDNSYNSPRAIIEITTE